MHPDSRESESGGVARSLSRGLIPDWLDAIFLRSLVPAIRSLVEARVNPNWLTVLAFVFTLVAALLIVFDHLLLAFVCVVSGGILDFVDGKVAVLTGKVSRAGAVLDSCLDRYSDVVVYLALVIYFATRSFPLTAFAAVFAIVGSMMTSYVMALAKSNGVEFRIGVLRRQDRITLISIGLLLAPTHRLFVAVLTAGVAQLGVSVGPLPLLPLATVVWALAALTNVTALQRFFVLLRAVDRDMPQPTGQDEVSLREKQLAILEEEIVSPYRQARR